MRWDVGSKRHQEVTELIELFEIMEDEDEFISTLKGYKIL
jgi:hypothetical protein